MTDFRTSKKFFASSSAVNDGYKDIYLDRVDGEDTIFAKDMNDLADSVLTIQKAIVDGYAVSYWFARSGSFSNGDSVVYNSATGQFEAGNNIGSLGSSVTITPTSNQLILGTTRTVTLTAPTPATASRTHTIPDVGANASFVMTEGDQTIAGNKTFSNTLITSGGVRQAVRTATATGALNATDNFVIVAPASANATMTLPAHAAGLTITVKRNSASFLVFVAAGSGTIDGSSSNYALSANFQAATFVSNGVDWFVI